MEQIQTGATSVQDEIFEKRLNAIHTEVSVQTDIEYLEQKLKEMYLSAALEPLPKRLTQMLKKLKNAEKLDIKTKKHA